MKSFDLEATEFFVRSSMHKAGAWVLEKALKEIGHGSLEEPPLCKNNHRPARLKSLGLKKKTLRTILGQAPWKRTAWQCPVSGQIEYPADKLLDVVGTHFSPGARRMMARQGANDCFREGAENLEFFADLRLGAIEPSVDFGYRIKAEALRRGLIKAKRVVALTDGAAYNKTIIAEHFPGAIRVLDYYHATEHLGNFLRDVCRQPADGDLYDKLRDLIWNGQIDDLTERMRALMPRIGERRKRGEREINYFKNNAPAMRYAEFRAQGIFIGSGIIEASCKTVIGKRLKQSGMFWTVAGANAIIALRCCLVSGRFEQFWEDSA